MFSTKGTACAVAIAFAGYAAATWPARYDGRDHYNDYLGGMASDDTGNVYVAAHSQNTNDAGSFVTYKLSPSGVRLWTRVYSAPGMVAGATAIALDDNGNVYTTGWMQTGPVPEVLTTKYTADGLLVWRRRYNGPYHRGASGLKLAATASGTLYIAGAAGSTSQGTDFLILSYDRDGARRWTRLYNGPANGDDIATDIALDSRGDIVVAGTSPGVGTRNDFAVVKLDSVGNRLWSKRYGTPNAGDDQLVGMTIDTSDNIIVTGSTFGEGSQPGDVLTAKWDVDGDRKWVRRFGGSINEDQAWDVATDTLGNVYISGFSGPNQNRRDILLLKYNPIGTKLWHETYSGHSRWRFSDDEGYAVAVSGSSVYVGGFVQDSTGQLDAMVLRYSNLGVLVSSQRYDSPANLNDAVERLLIAPTGAVYAGGTSMDSAGFKDVIVLKPSG